VGIIEDRLAMQRLRVAPTAIKDRRRSKKRTGSPERREGSWASSVLLFGWIRVTVREGINFGEENKRRISLLSKRSGEEEKPGGGGSEKELETEGRLLLLVFTKRGECQGGEGEQ